MDAVPNQDLKTEFIAWQAKYRVGEENIDAQHKRIIDVINQLYDAIQTGSDNVDLDQIIRFLIKYTNTHFAFEERMMLDIGYPGFGEHVKRHRQIAQRIRDFARDHHDQSMEERMKLFDFLKEWWNGHIQEQDYQYRPYIPPTKA